MREHKKYLQGVLDPKMGTSMKPNQGITLTRTILTYGKTIVLVQ